MKKELMVRFANESIYYTRITVSLDKIKNPLEFPNEVFFTVDDDLYLNCEQLKKGF